MQYWKIGIKIPNVPDNISEQVFDDVTKALYKITDKYPELKDWKGFKHLMENDI